MGTSGAVTDLPPGFELDDPDENPLDRGPGELADPADAAPQPRATPALQLRPLPAPAAQPQAATLPDGFTLDPAPASQPAPTAPAPLPPGFELDAPPAGGKPILSQDPTTGKYKLILPQAALAPAPDLRLSSNPDLNNALSNLLAGEQDMVVKQPMNAAAAIQHMTTGEPYPAAGSSGNLLSSDPMQRAAAVENEIQSEAGPDLGNTAKGWLEQKIPRTVGNLVGLTAAAGASPELAPVTLPAAMGAGAAADKYKEAKQAGATDAQALGAAGFTGGINAAAGALLGPVAKVARLGAGGPLADAIEAGAKPTLAQAAKFVGLDAAGQSAVMAGSQLTTNAADKVIYDPTRPLTEGVGESAVMGAGFGLMHAPELADAALRSGGDIVPQNPKTLQIQQQEMVDGKRDAMLFSPGEKELPVPDGFSRLKTDDGIFHYDPEAIEPEQIKLAVEQDRLGDVLDYGIPSKPDPTQPHTAVVRRDAEGNEIESVVTDQAHLPQVLAKQGERAEPGQTVATESPADVIAGRTASNGMGNGMTPEEFTAQQEKIARQKRLDYYAQRNAPMTDDRSQQIAQESLEAQQQQKLKNAQAALDRAAQLKAQQETDAQAKAETLQNAPDDTVADMAHNGDADAHNELLARNDGNDLEYQIALQDAANRKAERMEAARGQDQYDQESREFAGENPAQGPELLDAIKQAGGLPYADADGLTGELATLREGAPRGLFNRQQTRGLDRLRDNLADKGFDFETPDDLVQAVGQRLRTGKPQYGEMRTATEDAGQLRFARNASPSDELDPEVAARLAKKLEEERQQRQIKGNGNHGTQAQNDLSGHDGEGSQALQRAAGDYDELAKNGHDTPERAREETRLLVPGPGESDRDRLYRWAVENKRLIPIRAMRNLARAGDIGQSEHEVYPVVARDKMVKVTHAGKYGLSHTLDNYLDRMAKQNALTHGLNIRFLGFTPDEDSLFPKAVTDMTLVDGVHPEADELHKALVNDLGFEQTDAASHGYRHRDTGVEITDAHKGNFIKTPEGEYVPIDIGVEGNVSRHIFMTERGEQRFARGDGENAGTITPKHITDIATKDSAALPDLWTKRALTMSREAAATMLDNMGRKADAAAMRRGEIQDVYDPARRRAVIVPENMRDQAQARAVMREVAIHDLLNHPDMQEALKEFFDRHMTQDDVTALARRGYTRQEGESLDAYRRRMADEWIAQNGKANTTLWQKFVAWVQQAAKRLFGKDLSREEIAGNYIDRASRLHESGEEKTGAADAAIPSYHREGTQGDYLNDRLAEIDESLTKKTAELQRLRERGALKADIATVRRYIDELKYEKADLIAERDDNDPALKDDDFAGDEPPKPPQDENGKPAPHEPSQPDDVGTVRPWGLTKAFLGTKDIFNRTKGLEFLGKAIEKHVDTARRYQAELTTPFRDWANKYSRAERKTAMAEFEKYWGAKDAKDDGAEPFYEKASEAGKALIDTWREQAKRMGQANMINGLVVHDSTLNGGKGGYRSVGMVRDYFPRTLRQDVWDALNAPNRFPKKFDEVMRELESSGFAKTKEQALRMINTQFGRESTNDHFGNIEKARLLKLPSSLYDYSFDAARRYIMRWAERTGQIEAYGQKSGAHGKDLFDEALDQVNEQKLLGRIDKKDADATGQYINAVRDRAYGKKYRGPIWDAMRNLNALATGLHLANPANIAMNLQNGLGYNVSHFGVRAAVRGLADLHLCGKFFSEIEDAREKGIMQEDLMNMVQDAENAGARGELTQRFSSGALKYSGYLASENYVRATGMATAKAYLRQALRVWDKNLNGHAGMQYAAFFQRNGFDVRRLIMENGTGPATDAFLRGSVNDVHGGYRFDQTPAWMDTPQGRFFFKYQKWGSQMARNAYMNVFEPAIRGTDVRHVVDGKMVTTRVRSYAPLIRFAITAGLIGWSYDQMVEWLWGRPDQTASFSEIGKTLDQEFSRGLELIADKYITHVINSGALGTFGNYAQVLRDFGARSRFKNPMTPPALGVLGPSGELAMRLLEQGKLTGDDMENWLQGTSSQFRVLEEGGSRLLGAIDPVYAKQSMELRRQDLSWLGTITRRYASEVGLNTGNRMQFQRIGKTPDSPYKDAIREALLTGDRAGAADELRAYLATKSAAVRPEALESLRVSVRASQPLKVGSSSSEATQELFLKWAQERLEPQDVARIRDINQTYQSTAVSLGLMNSPKETARFSAKDEAILHLITGQ